MPGGVYQPSATSSQSFCSHVLPRRAPTKPLCYLPSGKQPSIAARFCPVLFKLASDNPPAGAQTPAGEPVDLSDDAAAPPTPAGGGGQGGEGRPLPTPSRLFEAGLNRSAEGVINTPYGMVSLP